MQTAKYNLTLQQGETVDRQFRLLTATGEPFDLTGYSVDSQIREEYTSPSASAVFAASVLVPQTSGTFQLSLGASGSAQLTASCYYYDVRISSGSSVYYPLEGKVAVSRRITR